MLNYHNLILNAIKKSTKCSYIAYERYENDYRIKTVKNGVQKIFALTGTPYDVKPEFYLELENMIKEEYSNG